MPDYGGANDGQCEYSFFDRCLELEVTTVHFGQQGGWKYKYCRKHADEMLDVYSEAYESGGDSAAPQPPFSLSRPAPGVVMCSICFAYRTPAELAVDEHDEVWDVCAGRCAEAAGIVERAPRQ